MPEPKLAPPWPFGAFVILLGALFTFFTPSSILPHALSVGFLLWLCLKKTARLFALSLLMGMGLGVISQWRVEQQQRLQPGQNAHLTHISATVLNDGRIDHTGRAMAPIRLDETHSRAATTQARGRATLIIAHSPVRLRAGMRLKVPLNEPLPEVNPYITVDGLKTETWQVLGYSHPLWAMRAQFLQRLEPWLSERLGASAPLVFASLTGDRSGLSITTQALFNKAGMSHLLALSGFHLGLVIMALSLFLWRLKNPRQRLLIMMPFFVGYLFLSGFSPSLLRAVGMACVALLILQARRSPTPAQNTLSLALLTIGVLSPVAFYSLSLQLSSLAVFGIIFFYAPFKRLFAGAGKWVAPALAVAAASQLAITPLVVARFGWVNLFSVVSGLVIVPLYTLFMGAALLALLLPFLTPLLNWVGAALMSALFYASWGHGRLASPVLVLITSGLLATLLLLWHNAKLCKR